MPVIEILSSGAGFLLLAASLVAKKRAGYFVAAGAVPLLVLAVWDSDPTLLLGVVALGVARLLKTPRQDPHATVAARSSRADPAPGSCNRP